MNRQKSTMSVSEMRKMLGIKKTDSYWLVHKNVFKTVTVEGKMRIEIDSFERWYACQTHYKKINGEEPGHLLKQYSYSVCDLSDILGVCEDSIRELIKREKWTIIDCDHQWRISKYVFEKWYKTQDHYRTEADRERDRIKEESSLSLPEMGRLLCVDRNVAYSIVADNADLTVITVAGKKRVTRDSFEFWYSSQKEYVKFEDRSPDEQAKILEAHKDDLLGREIRKRMNIAAKPNVNNGKTYFTTKEAAVLLGIQEPAVIRLIQIGELQARKINRSWRISKEDIDWLIHNHGTNAKEAI